MPEATRLALVTWSAIAEPGDAIAHALVSVLGAAEALEWARGAMVDPVGASIELSASADRTLIDRAVGGVERWRLRQSAWDPAPHLERAAKVGARAVVRGSVAWPRALDDLGAGAPYCLWVRGPVDLDASWGNGIAVVGSRSSTTYGEFVAASLASGLADAGGTVVSGGAYGIDARAHRACLAAGGVTIAVMAGGVDRLYPEGNADLLSRVIETGAVVSEVPPGYAPHRHRFLTRNRVIASARATVVVEAALRSGALSTARHAAELGRPVGAVPGPVTSAASAGCHRLIQDGMALVSDARDVLDMVQPLDAARDRDDAAAGHSQRRVEPESFADPHQRQAFDAITPRGSTVAEVAAGAGLTPSEARAALVLLELEGMVTTVGGMWRTSPRRR